MQEKENYRKEHFFY